MRNNKGFTLVEILIVVVILGILAAIVVPQFTSASSEAVKGALQSQIQTITSQVELYRVNNNGAYPDEDSTFGGTTNDGWGPMVGAKYLKEAPVNGYTGSAVIVPGASASASAYAATRTTAAGWYYEDGATAADRGSVYAAGFDPVGSDGKAALAHESNFNGASGASSGGSGGSGGGTP